MAIKRYLLKSARIGADLNLHNGQKPEVLSLTRGAVYVNVPTYSTPPGLFQLPPHHSNHPHHPPRTIRFSAGRGRRSPHLRIPSRLYLIFIFNLLTISCSIYQLRIVALLHDSCQHCLYSSVAFKNPLQGKLKSPIGPHIAITNQLQ